MTKNFHIEKVDNGWVLTTTVGTGLTSATNRQIFSDFEKLTAEITRGLEYVR